MYDIAYAKEIVRSQEKETRNIKNKMLSTAMSN